MSLKALLGDAYREDMTAAEIEAALAGRRLLTLIVCRRWSVKKSLIRQRRNWPVTRRS